jgi:hypothetical protein
MIQFSRIAIAETPTDQLAGMAAEENRRFQLRCSFFRAPLASAFMTVGIPTTSERRWATALTIKCYRTFSD